MQLLFDLRSIDLQSAGAPSPSHRRDSCSVCQHYI